MEVSKEHPERAPVYGKTIRVFVDVTGTVANSDEKLVKGVHKKLKHLYSTKPNIPKRTQTKVSTPQRIQKLWTPDHDGL